MAVVFHFRFLFHNVYYTKPTAAELKIMTATAIPSARAKFNRAVQQFGGLQGEFSRFLESKPYRVVTERDAEADKWVIAQYPDGDFPAHWPLLLGEIIYNLRSSMDHAVYELTILNIGHELEGTEFPVFTDPAVYFEKKKGAGDPSKRSGIYDIRGLTAKTQAVIEIFQPFNVKNLPVGGMSTMGLLNEMCNIDKHRTLHICRRRLAGHMWEPTKGAPGDGTVELVVGGNPNQRAELFRWPCSMGTPEEMGMKAEMHFEIAFDEGSAVGFTEPQPIILIGNQIIQGVNNLLTQLEDSVR